MSDEVELKRWEEMNKRFHSIEGQGAGETFVDLESEVRELGIVND